MGQIVLHPLPHPNTNNNNTNNNNNVSVSAGAGESEREVGESHNQVLIRSEAERVYSRLRAQMLSSSLSHSESHQQQQRQQRQQQDDSIFFDASDLFTTRMSSLTSQWLPLFQRSFTLVKDLLRRRFEEVVEISIADLTDDASVGMPSFSSLVAAIIDKAIDECSLSVEERVEEILRREESPLSLASGGGEVLENIRRKRVERFKSKVEDVIEVSWI